MSNRHKDKQVRRSYRSDSESSNDKYDRRKSGDRRKDRTTDRRGRDDSRERRRQRHHRDESPKRDRYRRSPERQGHRRHRSRTPEKEKRPKDKPSDTGDRHKKKEVQDGRFRWDSPPKEEDKQRTILAAAAQIGAQAGSLEEAQSLLQNIGSLSMAQTAKIDRKLYVGNLPMAITQRMLIDVMNEAMTSLDKIKDWNLEPGQPVISSWISTDGHYGFIEFRTAKEADLGFNLQGMTFEGNELRIGRPKAYLDNANDQGPITMIVGGAENVASGIQNPLMGGSAQSQLLPLFGPSKILWLKNITNFQLMNKFETCREVYTEIFNKCSEFGEVKTLKMPRPIWIEGRQQKNAEIDKIKADQTKKDLAADFDFQPSRSRKKKEKQMLPIDDIRNFDLPSGFGNIYVEFDTLEHAVDAKRNMNMLNFDSRLIEAHFWDEHKFQKDDYKMPTVQATKERDTAYIGIENLAIDFA